MKNKTLSFIFAALMASSVAGGTAAFAASHDAGPIIAKSDKAGHGHGKGNSDNDKGRGAGNDHGDKHGGDGHGSDDKNSHARFADDDRNVITGWYDNDRAAGNCPPGLAKKNNGCLPPGQARKAWSTGAVLPTDLRYYDLPGSLLGRLQPVPAGYRYVQLDGDVLLIEVASRVIYDVIELY